MALQTKDFTKTAKSSGGGVTYTYIMRVTENSIDTVKNCSSVTVKAILKSSYSGTAFSGYRTGVSCTVNGQTLFSDYCRRSISGKQEHVYYTWTGELPHDTDGTLTIRVSGKLWQTKAATYTPPTMNIPEGTMTMTPIPRASRLGADDAVIGGRSTVVITPVADKVSHTLGYRFGNLTGYIDAAGEICDQAATISGNTVSFRIPDSFYGQIPEKAWDNCELTCTTYRGGVSIGSQQTLFRVTAEESRCCPVVQLQVADINAKTLALTGNAGTLVRYMSTLRATLTAQGRNGAQITHRYVGNKALTGQYLDIPRAEQGRISGYAVDSRKYRTTAEVTLPMISYVKLTNNATATRTASTSGQVKLIFAGSCYKGSFGAVDNSLHLQYRVCQSGGAYGAWQDVDCTIGNGHTYRQETVLSDLDYTKAYTVQTRAADALDTVDCEVSVLPGIPVFHWYKDRFVFRVPVECHSSVAGMFVCRHTLYGGNQLAFSLEEGQCAFIFGAGGRVCGTVGSGGVWWGSDTVSVQVKSGQTVLTFSQLCSGELLLLSARPLILQ